MLRSSNTKYGFSLPWSKIRYLWRKNPLELHKTSLHDQEDCLGQNQRSATFPNGSKRFESNQYRLYCIECLFSCKVTWTIQELKHAFVPKSTLFRRNARKCNGKRITGISFWCDQKLRCFGWCCIKTFQNFSISFVTLKCHTLYFAKK